MLMKQRGMFTKLSMSALRVAILSYLGFGILLAIRQDSYIFFPVPTPIEDCPELTNATIVNMNGTRGYFLHTGGTTTIATSTRIAVSYHGNGERACDSAFMSSFLTALGYDIIFVEYAGYAGDASTKPSMERLFEDTRNVNDWVGSMHYREITIIGRSIGSAFASYHAARAHPDRLMLISPFDVYSRTAQGHYPVYPVKLMLKSDPDNIKNAAGAKRILIIHGENDVIIPLSRAQALYDELPEMDKEIVIVPATAHIDVLSRPEIWDKMREFLR
jgi:uncharacterized protein